MLTRAGGLKPLVEFLGDIGASVPRLLGAARMPADLLDDPQALIPMHLVHRFVETAAASQGIENLGAVVAARTSVFDIEAADLGQTLRRAGTVYEYLQAGSEIVGSVTRGERFWLTLEQDRVRFHHMSPGRLSAARCHEDIFVVLLTIRMLREFVDKDWQPGSVCLMAADDRMVGDLDVFGLIDVQFGQPHSSFTMPFEMLRRPISAARSERSATREPTAARPAMPENFLDSVEALVQSLLTTGGLSIDLVAEASALSVRSLQRRLLDCGRSYSDIVQHARIRLACDWLLHTRMAVRDIAFALGYTNAPNFTRSFRREMGFSPHQFRYRH